MRQVKEYWAIEHLHRYGIAQKLVKGKRVVDIACGDGYGSYLMSKYASKVTGIDISQDAVNYAKECYVAENLNFIEGSAFNIPLEDKCVDVVVSFETIEHHDLHEEMMAEVLRILKNDGLLIISSPDKLNYSDKPKYKNPYHVKELYFHEFKDLIQKHFSKVIFFRQKSIIGSLIVSSEVNGKLIEIVGDYDHVGEQEILKNPMYHLAICSNDDLDMDYLADSFFSAEELTGANVDSLFRGIKQTIDEKNNLIKSWEYKIGKKIYNLLGPLVRFLK